MPRLHARHGKAPVRSPPPQLVLAVDLPRVLSSLVSHLDWPDLLSLLNTCSHCRNIFLEPSLREVILSRLVPGYADALRLRDPTNYHDLPVSLHDLDLLRTFFPSHLFRQPLISSFLFVSHFSSLSTSSLPNTRVENYDGIVPHQTRRKLHHFEPNLFVPSSLPLCLASPSAGP